MFNIIDLAQLSPVRRNTSTSDLFDPFLCQPWRQQDDKLFCQIIRLGKTSQSSWNEMTKKATNDNTHQSPDELLTRCPSHVSKQFTYRAWHIQWNNWYHHQLGRQSNKCTRRGNMSLHRDAFLKWSTTHGVVYAFIAKRSLRRFLMSYGCNF